MSRIPEQFGWYAAHVVVYFENAHIKRTGVYPLMENIHLVQAANERDALRLAKALGKASAFADPSFTYGGRAARRVFGGVRKIVKVSPPILSDDSTPATRVESGCEATFNQLRVRGRRNLRRFVEGREVEVCLESADRI
ncbi:MAG: DUF4288 domain-containing protein [Deltaproteobacteria bacterium]|nr:DUF4288 domain-containing protein [Deltaproteobacteria bacterium]